MKLKRRFVGCAAGTPATGTTAMAWPWRRHPVSHWRPRSSIAVLESHDYSDRLEALLLDGLRLFRLKLAGKSVLLKPNLVEDLPGPVNTDAMLIGAAARCFLRLGASTVVIGEGPGHQRDTELVVWSAGLRPHLSDRQIRFVDLNRDELTKVKLQNQIQRSRRALAAAYGLGVGFRRVDAQGQDASLGGGHAELEEYVWHRARYEIRLAEKLAGIGTAFTKAFSTSARPCPSTSSLPMALWRWKETAPFTAPHGNSTGSSWRTTP